MMRDAYYLFAGAEDQDEEASVLAGASHIGCLFQPNDAHVTAFQTRQIPPANQKQRINTNGNKSMNTYEPIICPAIVFHGAAEMKSIAAGCNVPVTVRIEETIDFNLVYSPYNQYRQYRNPESSWNNPRRANK